MVSKDALPYKVTLKNQDILIIKALVIGSKVSIMHRLRCN